MKKAKFIAILSLIMAAIIPAIVFANDVKIKLDKAPIDRTDLASLQRGAKTFVNNCQGCHSLKYVRYDGVAKDIGITDEAGNVLSDIVKKDLVFVGDKITDPMLTAMPPKDAENWFGKAPPDLSLIARQRGADWLYTYLRTFYKDPTKHLGVNNLAYPDVGMPHVLVSLQGVQEPVYKEVKKVIDGKEFTEQEIVKLQLAKSGSLSPAEYDRMVADLVNFLDYVGEPVKLKRERIGVFVLAFLGILLIFTYLLKREYWKDIH